MVAIIISYYTEFRQIFRLLTTVYSILDQEHFCTLLCMKHVQHRLVVRHYSCQPYSLSCRLLDTRWYGLETIRCLDTTCPPNSGI